VGLLAQKAKVAGAEVRHDFEAGAVSRDREAHDEIEEQLLGRLTPGLWL
jgi:hypothetical protein